MRYRGQNVLGIGVTMAPAGDVIALGKRLDAATALLRAGLPAGLALEQVTSMPQAVARSVDDFIEAVAEAIGIVLAVSLLSLGVRTGMVVVISIPLVLAATALVHVPVSHRAAQGLARHPDPGTGTAGRRCDHLGRDHGGEARAGLQPAAGGGFRLYQHRVPDADRTRS